MIELAAVVVLVFIISLVFSMFGKGGGELYLPVMLTLLNIAFYVVAGVSLFIIFIQSISMILVFSKKHKLVDWKLAIVLASVVGVFSYLGGYFSKEVPALYLKLTFAIFLLISAILLFLNKKMRVQEKGKFGIWHRILGETEYNVNILYLVVLVGLVGFFAGMIGISGGGLIVPIAVMLGGVPLRIAMGTNTVLVLASSSMGFLGHMTNGAIDWTLCAVLSVAVIFGSQIGSRMHAKVSEKSLRIGLAAILTFAALWMIVRIL